MPLNEVNQTPPVGAGDVWLSGKPADGVVGAAPPTFLA